MPLVIVAVGVALLLLLMIRLKLNGFIALILVALAVGIMQGMPVDKVINSIKNGVGGTLGSLALIMGFGAMLGKMLADCGGAQRIATTLIDKFGKNYIQWAVVWSYIMTHIASGSPDWLNIVPIISTTGAEGWNEDISSALAMAIPKNASGVVAVIDDAVVPRSTDAVCSMPLYQGAVAELNQYVVDAIRALHKTTGGKNCLDTPDNVVGQSTEFSEDL